MSFGASPSDIIIVVTFCRSLYRKCRDAGGEYDEISREVRGLHTVLKHLKYEVEAPDSPLNRDHSIWGRQMAPIIGDCDFSLRQLDDLLQKYGRLSTSSDKSPSSPRVLWDRVRFGSNEMDQLGTIRVKLISHKTSLTLFLDTIQLHQSGKMTTTLDNQTGQLDVILDKVDTIAARMGQKAGTLMTNYDDDDKEVWKQFRRELVAEGFSSSVLTQHKEILRAYIREIDQQGLLDEMPPQKSQTPPPSAGVNAERWLESVHPAAPVGADPAPVAEVLPSFDSLSISTEDSGAKEMVFREDNMKFDPSIKLERLKPKTQREVDPLQQLEVPSSQLSHSSERRTSSGIQRQSSPIPKLITSDEKQPQFFNTSGSDSESESDNSSNDSRSSSKGVIIRTSELLALSQALTLRSSGSPRSYNSHMSFADEDVKRSIAYRPKDQADQKPSPTGAMVIPAPANNRVSGDRFGTSPRPELERLAPDSQGNEIPPDAKWTKINRRLVSPEVLDQDRKRYEARPDFVAVLGTLSRKEIEDYAVRSHILREKRARRNHPPPPPQPTQPSRPSQRAPPRRNGRDTPSDEEEDESTDSEHQIRRERSRDHRTFPPASQTPRSAHQNPYASQAPPSPMWSPNSTAPQPQPTWMQSPPSHNQGGIWIPNPPSQSNQGYVYHPRSHSPVSKEREREKDSHHSKKRHGSKHSSHGKSSGSHREKEREKEVVKKGRWKENLTAAGIGGAAVSLLNVLSEAAEGL